MGQDDVRKQFVKEKLAFHALRAQRERKREGGRQYLTIAAKHKSIVMLVEGLGREERWLDGRVKKRERCNGKKLRRRESRKIEGFAVESEIKRLKEGAEVEKVEI